MDDEKSLAYSSRHLRGKHDEPSDANEEEQEPNVDIIISDAAKKMKKATWWKYFQGKDVHQARKDLGMGLMGQEAVHHKNAEELKRIGKCTAKVR
ncbi:hypothetical protein P3T76_002651 [Phytophthora citrophthora]|uniref:RxLR effector protein n=1 Tax=Phytophthora citrophthora TaxID=4793 RepID=A0AAD9GX11_9STRA|nr:hypothetical protein P3T76_002651 [Phytophthora citrophthora]